MSKCRWCGLEMPGSLGGRRCETRPGGADCMAEPTRADGSPVRVCACGWRFPAQVVPSRPVLRCHLQCPECGTWHELERIPDERITNPIPEDVVRMERPS